MFLSFKQQLLHHQRSIFKQTGRRKSSAALFTSKQSSVLSSKKRSPRNTSYYSRNIMSRKRIVMEAAKRLLANTLLLLFISQALLVSSNEAFLFQQQVDNQESSSSLNNEQPPAAQHQEILVQPNSIVRIECKLPHSSSDDRYYLWNFRQTATVNSKPHTLCYETKCSGAKSFGFYLDANLKTGNYDLINNNVTYELNDGYYYCDYSTDSNGPESRQTREYRLTVLIPPQAPTIVASTSGAAREGQEHQLNCMSLGGNPEPNITWFRNQQALPPTGMPGIKIEQSRSNGSTSSVLSLIPTLEDHQAVYKCQVWNKAMVGLAPFEQEHKLYVEYAPRVSVGPLNPLKVLQGSQVTLACSVDANPGVKSVKWFKDGHLISNQFNYTIHETKISDSSLFTCQADNGIAPLINQLSQSGASSAGSAASAIGSFFGSLLGGGSSSSSSSSTTSLDARPITHVDGQLQLQVLYPPTVQIKPSRRDAVQQGESYQLTCHVDSNPAPYEYVWTKHDDPSFRRSSSIQGGLLEFPAASASDAGNYTCTAFVRLEPSNMNQIIERQASASYQMNVYHTPGVAEIVLGSNNEAELGGKAQILCRAKPPGYPEPNYLFWKYSSHNSNQKIQLTINKNHGPIFTLNSVQASDEGKYSCLAKNELGSSTDAEGLLIVNEPPKIIDDSNSAMRSNNDVRQQGESPYFITIRAQAKPEPKVTWYHRSPIDGKRVELSSLEMQYKFNIDTSSKQDQQQALRPRYNVVTTLTFKHPLEVDDRGLYSVEFNNGLSKSATQEFQLHINHTPIPAPRGQPILSAPTLNSQPSVAGSQLMANSQTRLKAGFDLRETVSLVCRVSAWPQPEFEWSAESPEGYKPVTTSARYRTSLVNLRDDIWESTLTFSNAQESDYGDYLCASANMDSRTNKISENLNIIIKLAPKSQPDPPTFLEAIDSSQDSVSLQWVPGFDGGFPEVHYLIQYAPDDGSGSAIASRFPSADSQGAIAMASTNQQHHPGYHHSNMLDSIDTLQQQHPLNGWPRIFDCQSQNPCSISQLSPRQAYLFRVRAKNFHGASGFSEEIRAMTRANMSQIPNIAHASYDSKNNYLHFEIKQGSDYLLNNLNARIEVKPYADAAQQQSTTNQLEQVTNNVQEISAQQAAGEWRPLSSVGPLRQEKVEAYLAMPQDIEMLKITLCSRTNDSLCGPEYVVAMRALTSSFLHDQRGLSYSILLSSLTLIVLVAAFATSLHSCCLSRRKNKNVDEHLTGEINQAVVDNKPISNGHQFHQHHQHKQPHHGGSTTSTNSTSAGGNGASNGSNNGLQSIDSINNNNALSSSDHSSDHSRQAKLDSMLPPNYNHYADRATILMEQQQLLNQQQHNQQQGLLADKLSSPFHQHHLTNGLSAASQQIIHSPMINGQGGFTYGILPTSGNEVPSQQQQPMSLDGGLGTLLSDPSSNNMANLMSADNQQQLMSWPATNQQQVFDDYNYNALTSNANLYGTTGPAPGILDQQQLPPPQSMVEPTYGTTSSIQQQQQYANGNDQTNSGHFQSYFDQQQQVHQYQSDMAQQAMYGTLKDNSRHQQQQSNGYATSNGNSPNDPIMMSDNSQLLDQQAYNAAAAAAAAAANASANGLLGPPHPPDQIPLPPGQESDYGTVGRARSRVIREIIV